MTSRFSDIVVTGVSILSPIGFGYDAMKRGLRRSESRIGKLTQFPELPETMALLGAELNGFDPKDILGAKGLRLKDRNTLIVLSCLQLGLGDAIKAINQPEKVGLVVGTTFGSLKSQIDFTATYIRDGFKALNAGEFPNMVINSPPSQGNIWFDLAHSSTTISNAFTAGLDALIYAADMLKTGHANHMVAGGADEFSVPMALAMQRRGMASQHGVVRPFDAKRDGMLMGEGAAMLLLETRAAAEARGAKVLAEICGYGASFDGKDGFLYNTEADGATYAMMAALESSGLSVKEIDFVAASANGHRDGDAMEASALARVFGSRLTDLPIVAYSGYWGNAYGASGAMQLVAALADIDDDTISSTCGFQQQAQHDPKLWVTKEPVKGKKPKTAMINSFGITGHNAAMIIRKAS